jgi:hypothetical protein
MWPRQIPPPAAEKVLKKNLPFTPSFSPTDQAWVDAQFAENAAAYTEMATQFYLRQIARMDGTTWLMDQEPAARKHFYAVNPPLLVDGTIPTPEWLALSVEMPAFFAEVVADYNRLVKEEVVKVAQEAADAYGMQVP